MPFTLPNLPYASDALAPVMSAETLELHHGKHHQAYVTKLNELVPGSAFEGLSLEEIIRGSFERPGAEAIFNNAGQHWNHNFFWPSLGPDAGGMPGRLESRLKGDFGTIDAFKAEFVKQGLAQFGSGWVWLVQTREGRLVVTKSANAINPLVHDQTPLLGCDVWEHAYYVDYRNRRADYLQAFVDHLVDWDVVASRLPA